MRRSQKWRAYYRATKLSSPRQGCAIAIDKFNHEKRVRLEALDLGSGAGNDSLALLRAGWRVTALDRERSALKILQRRIPSGMKGRVTFLQTSFEHAELPKTDLVNASAALSFCKPEYFPQVWEKILKSLRRNGRFAGDFFGPKDSWAGSREMTFLSKKRVLRLFRTFKIEMIQEVESYGVTALGARKRWHVITVVAVKR